MFLASVGVRGRPGQRRPPDAVALGPSALQHAVEEQLRRHAVPARASAAPRPARSTSASPPSRIATRAIGPDEVTYVSIGEGGTSEGEFWESLNTACAAKAAGRLPGRRQRLRDLGSRGGADRRRRHLRVWSKDSRASASSAATAPTSSPATGRCATPSRTRASARARCSCTRPSPGRTRTRSPMTSGSTRRRASARRKRAAIRCGACSSSSRRRVSPPIRIWPTSLASVEREVNQAAEEALRAPKPDPATASDFVFSPDVDPTSADFATEPQPQGKPDTMVAAINATLKDEMARDPRIVDLRPGRGRRQQRGGAPARHRQGRRVQGDARPAAAVRRARASSTRRSPKPTSSAAPSAWRCADSSRSSRSSSSTTSGRRSCRFATSCR